MKTILRSYTINTVSLYIVSTMASGIVFDQGVKTLLLAGIGLMISSLILKPIINILLLPINLITFGLFRWLSSAITIYLVTLLIHGFRIEKFYFAGLHTNLIDLPALSLGGIWSFVAFSLALSVVTSTIHWLFK